MKERKVLAFVPLPPPYAGPEIITQSLLESLRLEPTHHLTVVKSNVRKENESKGKFDFSGFYGAFKSLLRLVAGLVKKRPHTVYFLLSASKAGFLRDCAVVILSRLFFAKVVAHYHGGQFHIFFEKSSPGFKKIILFSLRRINKIIVQAECLKSQFRGLFPLDQTAVLYNAIPNDVARQTKHLSLQTREGEVSLLFLNHISFTKGFYDLLSAYENLRAKKVGVKLLVAGDPILHYKTQQEFLPEAVRQEAESKWREVQRKVESFLETPEKWNAEYCGIVRGEEKYDLYKRADIFVLPSYTEGFPAAVLEAMAFGLPLVLTPVGALPEVLNEGEGVYFTEPGNIKMLEEKLSQLIANSTIRQTFGALNYKKATEFFLFDKIQAEYQNLVFA